MKFSSEFKPWLDVLANDDRIQVLAMLTYLDDYGYSVSPMLSRLVPTTRCSGLQKLEFSHGYSRYHIYYYIESDGRNVVVLGGGDSAGDFTFEQTFLPEIEKRCESFRRDDGGEPGR